MCVETLFYDFPISKGRNQRMLCENRHARAHAHTDFTENGKLFLLFFLHLPWFSALLCGEF